MNPLYQRQRIDGAVRLTRIFPSLYFERDHPEAAQYLPEQIDVSSDVLAALEAGERPSEVEALVDRLVALAIPPRWG